MRAAAVQGEAMPSQFPPTWVPAEAARQARAFTTIQAIDAGMPKRQVAYRIATGLWIRVAGTALRHREDPPTPQMHAYAAWLTWPDAVLCGPSAAALMGAPIRLSPLVHVIPTVPRRPLLNLRPHVFPLERRTSHKWADVLVTGPRETFLDALVLLPPHEAQSLFVWLVTRGRLTVADFESRLTQGPGRWGNQRLRRLMAECHAGVMSPAEALLQKVLRKACITGWTPNAPIRDQSGIIARADILFAAERIVIEIDGRAFHGREQFQADRTRQNRLIAAGYLVLRFTWEDLNHRAPEVISQIRDLRATRAGR